MIKLTFLGDIMCKSELMEAFRTDGGFDFSELFSGMKDYFSKSDYVCGNLETPISYDNSDLIYEKYRFNSPYQFAEAAHESGIDFVATANNHCLNNGTKGISSTIKSLNKIGFAHTGVFDKKQTEPLVVEVDGIKLGFLAYTYGTNAFADHNYLKRNEKYMVNLFQNQELSNRFERYIYYRQNKRGFRRAYKLLAKICPERYNVPVYERRENDFFKKKKCARDIKTIREGGDIVIMYMHIGGQYNAEANAYTKHTTDWLLKQGVNIVVGSHEHVVHGGVFDRIDKNRIATYSLGNFDGISGVYDEPMDKMSEYSVAWNVFVEKNAGGAKIVKSTFSVLKTIETQNKRIKVVPCYDLYNMLSSDEEKKKLLDDVRVIAERFLGKEIVENFTIKEEFEI